MATLTVRDVDDTVVDWLKQQAKSHQRSLEAEVRTLLDREARQRDMSTWLRRVDRIRRQVSSRRPTDPSAAELVDDSRRETR